MESEDWYLEPGSWGDGPTFDPVDIYPGDEPEPEPGPDYDSPCFDAAPPTFDAPPPIFDPSPQQPTSSPFGPAADDDEDRHRNHSGPTTWPPPPAQGNPGAATFGPQPTPPPFGPPSGPEPDSTTFTVPGGHAHQQQTGHANQEPQPQPLGVHRGGQAPPLRSDDEEEYDYRHGRRRRVGKGAKKRGRVGAYLGDAAQQARDRLLRGLRVLAVVLTGLAVFLGTLASTTPLVEMYEASHRWVYLLFGAFFTGLAITTYGTLRATGGGDKKHRQTAFYGICTWGLASIVYGAWAYYISLDEAARANLMRTLYTGLGALLCAGVLYAGITDDDDKKKK